MNSRAIPQAALDVARNLKRYRDTARQLQEENRDLKKKIQMLQASEKQNLAQAVEERIAQDAFKNQAYSQITALTGENEGLKVENERLSKSIMAVREETAEQRLMIDQMSQEMHDLKGRIDATANFQLEVDEFHKVCDRVREIQAAFNDNLEFLNGTTERCELIKTYKREIEYLNNDVNALNAEVCEHEEKAAEHDRRRAMLADAQQRNSGLQRRNADLEALVETMLPQCRFPFNVRAFLRRRARETGMPYGFDSPSHFSSDDFDGVTED
jgi:DNA repair exonuclease SbcCD ATPase subunit